MTTHAVRSDALPEYHQYDDEGCNFFPTCLCCPADFCRFDARKGIYTLRTLDRDRAIIEGRRRHGLTLRALAVHHGVSVRTVYRILAQAPRSSP
jgi:hypothetical protein